MRVLVKDNLVDFEKPISLEDDQCKRLLDFLRKTFPGQVEVIDVTEPVKTMGPTDSKDRAWTPEERLELLKGVDISEFSKRTGRSEMSIGMQYGHFVPEFWVWAKKKGYSQDEAVTLKTLKEYLWEKKK